MQRRGICFQRAKLCSLCWRSIQRARGKKIVILAPLLEMLLQKHVSEISKFG
jgi:hypothetical protein